MKKTYYSDEDCTFISGTEKTYKFFGGCYLLKDANDSDDLNPNPKSFRLFCEK